jgi:single-stranded DNA-binding protein
MTPERRMVKITKGDQAGTEKAVVNVNAATDIGFGDNKIVVWTRLTFWGAQADFLANNCDKGDLIFVEDGTLQPVETYEGKDGKTGASINVTVRSFTTAKKKSDTTPGVPVTPAAADPNAQF